MEKQRKDWLKYRGRLIGLAISLIFSILFITCGFGTAVAVLFFLAIGYLIGKWMDGQLDVHQFFEFLFRK